MTKAGSVAAGCFAAAGLSLAIVAPAPGYDAWTWLRWGRELAGGGLDTAAGPAFKPLPVALAVPLSALGTAAPVAFVLLERAGAVLALVLAFRLARGLAGGSAAAGALGAAGVALCGGFAAYAAAGLSEGLLLALALAAAEAWRTGRPRWALACAVGCGLLRVEAWPFLLVAGAAVWRRRPEDRGLLVAAAVLVPAAWLFPELVGSGDPLRSGGRARVPNPGQPALADVPAVASLREAAGLVAWPFWAGAAWLAWSGARRRDAATVLPVAAGIAWIALVALMAQAGFSGEPRYALPGAALVAIAGAAGLARLARGGPRPAAVAGGGAVALALAATPAAGDLRALPQRQAHQWRLQAELATAIRAAGGRDTVLRCGRPYVGRLRGPLMAYRLGVAKRAVEPDRPPRAPGVVFRSARRRGERPSPAAPPAFLPVARAGPWLVLSTCPVRAT